MLVRQVALFAVLAFAGWPWGTARVAAQDAFDADYVPGIGSAAPAYPRSRPSTWAEEYWTRRTLWEQQMRLRRRHPSIDEVMRWGAMRAPLASVADFEKAGNVKWPARIWESPLADDAARLDALCMAQWKSESGAPHQAVALVDRMLKMLQQDLPNWRPMDYSQTKAQLVRLRNWALRGFE